MLRRAEWCTFAALVDPERVADFVEALASHIVSWHFIPRSYLVECVDRFPKLAPYTSEHAKELLRAANSTAAYES